MSSHPPLKATRCSGAGVAARALALQLPLIEREFPEIAGCHPGTINLELERPLLVRRGDHRTQPIEWMPGREEVFDLVRIQLRRPRLERSHAGWLYVARPSAHRATPQVHEVIAPYLDLAEDEPLELVIDGGYRTEAAATGEVLVVDRFTVLRCVHVVPDPADEVHRRMQEMFAQHAGDAFELVPFRVPRGMTSFQAQRQVILEHPDGERSALMLLGAGVELGETFFARIHRILSSKAFTQDVLATDVRMLTAEGMARVARLRGALVQQDRFTIVGLQRNPSADMESLAVHPRSLEKVRRILPSLDEAALAGLDPWRHLVRSGSIEAGCIFPFLTTVSAAQPRTRGRLSEAEADALVSRTFRRLMWIDRDVASCMPALEAIRDQLCDDESGVLEPVLCAQADARVRGVE